MLHSPSFLMTDNGRLERRSAPKGAASDDSSTIDDAALTLTSGPEARLRADDSEDDPMPPELVDWYERTGEEPAEWVKAMSPRDWRNRERRLRRGFDKASTIIARHKARPARLEPPAMVRRIAATPRPRAVRRRVARRSRSPGRLAEPPEPDLALGARP